jgi:hypothetical protein
MRIWSKNKKKQAKKTHRACRKNSLGMLQNVTGRAYKLFSRLGNIFSRLDNIFSKLDNIFSRLENNYITWLKEFCDGLGRVLWRVMGRFISWLWSGWGMLPERVSIAAEMGDPFRVVDIIALLSAGAPVCAPAVIER